MAMSPAESAIDGDEADAFELGERALELGLRQSGRLRAAVDAAGPSPCGSGTNLRAQCKCEVERLTAQHRPLPLPVPFGSTLRRR